MKIKQIESQLSSVFEPIHLAAGRYRPLHSFHSGLFIIAATRTAFAAVIKSDLTGLIIDCDRKHVSYCSELHLYAHSIIRRRIVAPSQFFNLVAL
jgi:hypothetical protein